MKTSTDVKKCKLADSKCEVGARDIASLRLVNKALSTCIQHWGMRIPDRIKSTERRENEFMHTIRHMNSETLCVAGAIIRVAERDRNRFGVTILKLDLQYIISDPEARTINKIDQLMLMVRRPALIGYLRMSGFALAESALSIRQTTSLLGYMAWDHGIEALYHVSMFGLKFYPPANGSCTDGVWTYHRPMHGEYDPAVIKAGPDALHNSSWICAMEEAVHRSHPCHEHNYIPETPWFLHSLTELDDVSGDTLVK